VAATRRIIRRASLLAHRIAAALLPVIACALLLGAGLTAALGLVWIAVQLSPCLPGLAALTAAMLALYILCTLSAPRR
jgi:hypothetical protein